MIKAVLKNIFQFYISGDQHLGVRKPTSVRRKPASVRRLLVDLHVNKRMNGYIYHHNVSMWIRTSDFFLFYRLLGIHQKTVIKHTGGYGGRRVSWSN